MEDGRYDEEQQETTTEQTEITTDQNHQLLIEPADQKTLQGLARSDLSCLGDMEGKSRIPIHGPCYHGPRSLLTITGDPQEKRLKVV